jgi:hypothetical protein
MAGKSNVGGPQPLWRQIAPGDRFVEVDGQVGLRAVGQANCETIPICKVAAEDWYLKSQI